MQNWLNSRTRIPYESPQAEVLIVRFEEQFLQGTNGYNGDNNGKPVEGEILDLGD
jgi:hypothetical protein